MNSRFLIAVIFLVFASYANADLKLLSKREFPSKYGTLLFVFPNADGSSFYAGFQNSYIVEIKSDTFDEIRQVKIQYYFGPDGYGHLFTTLQSNDSNTLYIGASEGRDKGLIVRLDLKTFLVTTTIPQPCKISLINCWWQDGYAVFSDRAGTVFVFDVTTTTTPQLMGGYRTEIGQKGDGYLTASDSRYVYFATMGLGWGKGWKLDPFNYYAKVADISACEGSDMSGPSDLYIVGNYAYLKCQKWGTSDGYIQSVDLNMFMPSGRFYYTKTNSTLFSYNSLSTHTAVYVTNAGDLVEMNPYDFSVVSSLQVYGYFNYQPVPGAFMIPNTNTLFVPMVTVSGAFSKSNVVKVKLT